MTTNPSTIRADALREAAKVAREAAGHFGSELNYGANCIADAIEALIPTDAPDDADQLADLVQRFSVALLDKLRISEKKRRYRNEWMRDDWRGALLIAVREHIVKGDPRDVAAYCAFAWHHGWSLSPQGNNMAFAAVTEAREDAKSRLGTLREAMRLRREREKQAGVIELPPDATDAPARDKGATDATPGDHHG